jgi:acyl-CoA dehydrogenase
MDLTLTPQDLTFRDEVRAFLKEAVPPSMRRAAELTTGFIYDPEVAVVFHRELVKKGWSVPNWPVEYGGTGWTPVQRYIFDTECARAGAMVYNGQGTNFVGPVIVRHAGAEGLLPAAHPLR